MFKNPRRLYDTLLNIHHAPKPLKPADLPAWQSSSARRLIKILIVTKLISAKTRKSFLNNLQVIEIYGITAKGFILMETLEDEIAEQLNQHKHGLTLFSNA